MSFEPKHFDARTGLAVDCKPGAAADPFQERCKVPDCFFGLSAMSMEALTASLWAHHVAVHSETPYALPTRPFFGKLATVSHS